MFDLLFIVIHGNHKYGNRITDVQLYNYMYLTQSADISVRAIIRRRTTVAIILFSLNMFFSWFTGPMRNSVLQKQEYHNSNLH